MYMISIFLVLICSWAFFNNFFSEKYISDNHYEKLYKGALPLKRFPASGRTLFLQNINKIPLISVIYTIGKPFIIRVSTKTANPTVLRNRQKKCGKWEEVKNKTLNRAMEIPYAYISWSYRDFPKNDLFNIFHLLYFL